MKDLIADTFRKLFDFIPKEAERVPLDCWNESVLRYFICRLLAESSYGLRQHVECDRIDLVLIQPPKRAFIEFKLYQHLEKFDPYDGSKHGYKGGPSAQNVAEFQRCIDDLCRRGDAPGLSKFIALVYVDAKGKRGLTFSSSYDNFHGDTIEQIATHTVQIGDEAVRGNLYEVIKCAATAVLPTN